MDEDILQAPVTVSQSKAAPLIATSLALARLPGLSEFLSAPVVYRWAIWRPTLYGGVIAWGRKPSASKAISFANRYGLSLLRLEDGFLRSVGLGNQEPPLSVVVDDLGIYYDATSPSRLEFLIAADHTDAQNSRSRSLIKAWREGGVSKYNHARDFEGDLPERYVLVADQTWGDSSIQFGLADASSFQRMMFAALETYPDCMVLLKIHPEVMSGRKRGHFDMANVSQNLRVRLLSEDVHPSILIQRAQAIYTVTSQMGFEGLLWGKRVHTFGMPFYAGWGLTFDDLEPPERRKQSSLENLVHAALVEYPRYIDPESGKRCEVERVLEWMAQKRRMDKLKRNLI